MKAGDSIMFIVIQTDVLEEIRQNQRSIIKLLEEIKLQLSVDSSNSLVPEYITAKKFREAISIKQWKFDRLVSANLIRTIKKREEFMYRSLKSIDISKILLSIEIDDCL